MLTTTTSTTTTTAPQAAETTPSSPSTNVITINQRHHHQPQTSSPSTTNTITDNYELQLQRLLHDSRATILSLDCCTTTTSDRPKLQLLHDAERLSLDCCTTLDDSASLDQRDATTPRNQITNY